jgi:site-specific DNA-methyltransferase (adenine-specific)
VVQQSSARPGSLRAVPLEILEPRTKQDQEGAEMKGIVPITGSQGEGRMLSVAEARRVLEECQDFKVVKAIHDSAGSTKNHILKYLKTHDDAYEDMADAAEIHIWAGKRLGELFGPAEPKAPPRHTGPGRGKKTPSPGVTAFSDDEEDAMPGRQFRMKCRYQSLVSDKDTEKYVKEIRGARKTPVKEFLIKEGWRIARQRRQRKRNMGAKPLPAGDVDGVPTGIVCGDVLKILKTIPDETFHLIVPDPPYNVGIDYGDGAEADKLPDEQYVSWCEAWLRECYRVLRPTGTFWLVIGDEYAAELCILLKQIGFHRRAWVKWYETFGVFNSDLANFSRCSRHLFYYVKNATQFTWNSEAFMTLSDRQKKYHDKRACPDGKILDDVWPVPRLTGTAKERMPDFPTQLPLELIVPIVRGCSDSGDFVLDPFAGSGTTGEAAIMSACNFLGIEKQEKFADWAGRRLARVAKEAGKPHDK